MSGTLFSGTLRRNSSGYRRVATTDERQGDGSTPPPSKSQGEWLCDEPYKYSVKSSNDPLEMGNEVVERHDENVCRQLKEEINFLMVVAGLFLAIVATFTVESYKLLQEDKQDTMSELLVEVVRLLNDTSTQGNARLPKPFTPKHHAIVVNQLWFLSMILSLVAVVMGNFCLQWISALSRGSDLTEKSIPPHKSLALRQLRHEGLVGWGVRYAPEVLLLIVQLSIGLFTSGLIYLLWNVNETAAIPALAAASFAGALLYLINLLPFLQPLVGAFIPATLTLPQCPYKSPTSWLVQSVGNVLPYLIKLFLNLSLSDWVGIDAGLVRWLKSRPLPFTGFDWKKYDETCQDLRARVRSRLSYYESGLISALDHSTYEGNAMDIISSYPGILAPFFVTAEDWEMFSQQNLSNDEKSFLNGDCRFASHRLPRHLDTVRLQLEYARKIRVDFSSALILQRLTRRYGRLARPLLDHRVELYIRVKNSTKFILSGDDSGINFGTSLDCPFEEYDDVEEMDLELKFQFLRCVRHLIDIRRFNDLDVMSAAAIVRSESAASKTLSKTIQTLLDNQHMDPPAEEEHRLHPNQSSFNNIQIRNLGTKLDPGTTSSPPNGPEKGGPGFATHDDTSAEDPQLGDSLTSLCSQVKERLLWLRRSDFKNEKYYVELREAFGLPVEPIPPGADNPRTGIEQV